MKDSLASAKLLSFIRLFESFSMKALTREKKAIYNATRAKNWYGYVVGLAQLVRVPGCGPGSRGFKSHIPPQFLQKPIGVSPSGKALDFDSSIRRFESCHPSQDPLAQSVEHLTFNQGVWGSNPQWVTKALIANSKGFQSFFIFPHNFIFGKGCQ